MSAEDILAAIRRHHDKAAIVPELTILDHTSIDRHEQQALLEKSCACDPPTRRIDALMFHGLERTAIEIKVTKADFRREGWNKRGPWVRVCHRFVYAVPTGLLDGEQVPYGCGIWEIDTAGRLTVKRKAIIQRHPEPLPQKVVQNLAYRACGRTAIGQEGTRG